MKYLNHMKNRTIGIIGGGLGMLHTVAEQLALRNVTIVNAESIPKTLKSEPEPLIISNHRRDYIDWERLSTPSKHQCLRKKPKRIKNKKTHRKKK